MPLFKYRACDQAGKKIEGLMPASGKAELAHTLKSQGMLLVFAAPQESNVKNSKEFILWKGVSLEEKMIFIKHLTVMIKAGIPLPRAFEILSLQANSPYFKEVITSIKESIKNGKSLADSMGLFPKVFSPIFVSTVKIGELGGNLEEVLGVLANQLQKEHDIRSKVKGAMIYPSVIVFAMIIIGILVMIFVVPSLTKIFADMNVELPLSTRMIIGISNFLRNNMVITLAMLAALPTAFYFVRKNPRGRKFLHLIILHLPVIKGVSQKVNTARFARSLSSLLRSGVPIVKALEIISESLDNYFFQEAFREASKKVKKGLPLYQSISDYKNLFPPMVSQMVRIGEETGSSEQILGQLADFYEKEVDELTKNLSSIIEPVLIMIIGGAVGIFAISVIQPMYTVMDYL